MPEAAAKARGRVTLDIDVRRADGTEEHHENAATKFEIAPEIRQVLEQVTANPNAQLLIALAAAQDPGVLVALRRAVGG